MEYAINHLHMRSSDHQGSAAWFEKHFGAKILSAREVMLGTKTGRIEVGSPRSDSTFPLSPPGTLTNGPWLN